MNNIDLRNKIEKIGKEIIGEKGYLSSIDVLLKLFTYQIRIMGTGDLGRLSISKNM